MNQQPNVTGGLGVTDVESPYPGLRPFKREESLIFFGRDRQIDQMLELLRRVRFLGVVGSSGCGKSSLVKAGLFPALHAGFLLSSNVPWADAARFPNWVASRWFTVDMRPGAHPFRGLARGLLDTGLLGKTWDLTDPGSVPALAARLQAGPRQLLKLWQQAEDTPTGNLLILADQFEELFRFRDGDNFGLAQSFVSSLMQLAAQDDWPIYVAITMRSDFLGECSQFLGLPEVLNQGQFLVPRPTNTETREAIERPARMFGVELDPLLMTRMLNDIGNDSDQLPLLQHALKRTWDLSDARHLSNVSSSEQVGNVFHNKRGLLTLADYDRNEIGGVTQALDRHAEELFAKLSGHDENDGDKRLARVLFQALTLRDNGRDVRRPTKLGVVAQIASVDEADVMRIVEVFRDPDCCFLMPPVGTPLISDAMLDISHESLLRQWRRLQTWIAQESDSAANYQRLLDAVRSQEDVLDGLRLDRAVKWRDAQRPTPVWAMRYDGAKSPEESLLPQCLSLITCSEQARTTREIAARKALEEKQAAAEREKELLVRRAEAKAESQRAREAEAAAVRFRRRTFAAQIALLFAVVFMVAALYKWREAKVAAEAAERAQQRAMQLADEAQDARQVADVARMRADSARETAIDGLKMQLRMFTEPTALCGRIAAAATADSNDDVKTSNVLQLLDDLEFSSHAFARTGSIAKHLEHLRQEAIAWEKKELDTEALLESVLNLARQYRIAWEEPSKELRPETTRLIRQLLVEPAYKRVIDVTQRLIRQPTNSQNRADFESLYWGELVLLEDRDIEAAMVLFRKALDGDRSDLALLARLAAELEEACRRALDQSTDALPKWLDEKLNQGK